jgi:peptidoglycan glycosyltransferase
VNKPIRTISLFCLFLFLALMVNATWLQYVKSQDYADDPRNRRVIEAAYSAERGAILVGRDPVAESKPVDDKYEFLREYAEPEKYAHLTGYFSYFSQTGVEQTQNRVLSGDDDLLFVTKLVDLLSGKAGKGGNVQLTIDRAAQDAAYDALEGLPGEVEASVVALEPATGKILAMASLPSYDPNDLASHDFPSVLDAYEQLDQREDEPLVNRAIRTTLPPGSVFKLVTAAAAIESGDYEASDDVPGGVSYQLPQTTDDSGLIDNDGRECGADTVSFEMAMGNSCNTTFAQLGVQLGEEKLREQAEAFGFNQDYFEDLGPQSVSNFPDRANPPQTGQSAIGQFEVQASPLQMAMVVAGIANQGTVMRPYLVDEVQSPTFEVLRQTEPEEFSEAVSASTADQLTDLMVYTVEEGTAKPAAINGIPVAGKTGTAQSGVEGKPPYAWYVSFAPADDPQVAVAVMIESVPGQETDEIAGGLLGGPIAKAVMEAVIR